MFKVLSTGLSIGLSSLKAPWALDILLKPSFNNNRAFGPRPGPMTSIRSNHAPDPGCGKTKNVITAGMSGKLEKRGIEPPPAFSYWINRGAISTKFYRKGEGGGLSKPNGRQKIVGKTGI